MNQIIFLMLVGMTMSCDDYICVGKNGCSMHTNTNGYILHEIETAHGSGYRILKMENDNLSVVYENCAIFQCSDCNIEKDTVNCECLKNMKTQIRAEISGSDVESEWEIDLVKFQTKKSDSTEKKVDSELRIYKNDILAYEGRSSWSIEKSDDPSDILRQIFTPENGEYHHPVYSDSAVFEVLKNGCRYVMHKPIKYVYCKSICDIEYSIVKNRSPLSDSLQFNGKNYKCDPGLDYEYLRSNMCVDANKKITDTEYYLVNGEKCTRKMANVAIPKNITIPMHKE